MHDGATTRRAVAVAVALYAALATNCGVDSSGPTQQTPAGVESAPIDTIFSHDSIFGHDSVVVATRFPAGCNRLRSISLQQNGDRVVFSPRYERFSPCVEGGDVQDPSTAWHAAGGDTVTVDLEFDRFVTPGRYYLEYATTTAAIVAVPITVLSPSTIFNVTVTPAPPAVLTAGDTVTLRFQYNTPVPGAIYFFVADFRYRGESYSFGQLCPSTVYASGAGTGSACFYSPSAFGADTIVFHMERPGLPRRFITLARVPANLTFVPR